jgi:preprotein translocase subunit SecE
MKKIIKFFNGVKKEVERVRWPNKKHMIKYSAATIAAIMFFALFFYAIDIIVAYIKSLG